eukprot:snap_masked-scaffold_12-processed-gene-9.23-mRNA-1 protein AED:1.00 eAED:1.00 QI:0/0/0/0/1/1/3/0/59
MNLEEINRQEFQYHYPTSAVKLLIIYNMVSSGQLLYKMQKLSSIVADAEADIIINMNES